MNLDEAEDKFKQVGIPGDEMAVLERQLAPAANYTVAKERRFKLQKKDVPSAVFGGLIRKRGDKERNGQVDGDKDKDNDNRLGALGRMKRQKMT